MRFLQNYRSSLFRKLFLSFFLIGFLPFLLLFLYIIYWAEDDLANNIIHEHEQQLVILTQRIQTTMHTLQKEIDFLAQLDSMNDILADDIDKRIARILQQKQHDLGQGITLIVIDNNNRIIASTERKKTTGPFHQEPNTLLFDTDIYASFQKKRQIGKLLLLFGFSNLQQFCINRDGIYSAIITKNLHSIAGSKLPFGPKLTKNADSYIDADYLILYKKLYGKLEDFYFIYGIDKKIAMHFLHKFLYILISLIPLVLFATFLSALYRSRKIISPITRLTDFTEQITQEKKYDRSIYINSEDEIGRLADAFNKLLQTITKTLSESKTKSVFISHMSHELRTPLNAILGFTQYLISYESLSETQQDAISKIENSAEYLLEMINSILDISKIEAGVMEVNPSRVDLAQTLKNIIMMLEPLAQQKNLYIEFTQENAFVIQTDKKLLQQIIINLLSNSIKFTREGSIKISIKQKGHNAFIEIRDSGIGIAPQDLEKLFDEFFQIDNDLQKESKGTGLGLSLSKRLAKLLGGDLIISSKGLSRGTRAILQLPFIKSS